MEQWAREGRVHTCLRFNRDKISPRCLKEENKLAAIEYSDIRLRPKLNKLCSEEKAVFCKDAKSGRGRVVKCLIENMAEPSFGEDCKVELEKREDQMKSDYRFDPTQQGKSTSMSTAFLPEISSFLAAACTGANQTNKEKTKLRGTASVLKCLAANYRHLTDNCQSEMSRAVRLALWDFKEGAPLTTMCDADVQAKCPKDKGKNMFSIGVVGRCLSKALVSGAGMDPKCRSMVLLAAPKDARSYFEYPESTSVVVQKIADLQRSAGLQLVDPYQRDGGGTVTVTGRALVDPYQRGGGGTVTVTGESLTHLAGNSCNCNAEGRARVDPYQRGGGVTVTVTGWVALLCIISLIVVLIGGVAMLYRRAIGADKPHTMHVGPGTGTGLVFNDVALVLGFRVFGVAASVQGNPPSRMLPRVDDSPNWSTVQDPYRSCVRQMANLQTLAESFLADLDDLSDDEEAMEEGDGEEDAGDDGAEDEQMDDIEALNFDDLGAVAKLQSTGVYKSVMKRVKEALKDPLALVVQGPLEDDPTYQLLVQCNKLAVDIDNETAVVHNFIRDKYRLKFPELESLVHHPVDYARVVTRIANEMDLTLVNLDDILPAAAVMVVTVTGTTTSGKPLSAENLARVVDACDMAFTLDEDKRQILEFVESKMHTIAPNLSAAVGSEVAARLMGVAGGLGVLSKMPACNIQVLGAKRRTLAGFSSTTSQPHQGFIFQCPIMQQTPPALRSKAARLLGGKCALLARVDAFGQDPSGRAGRDMRDEITRKIEKWQEPPPAKTVKPLKAPDAEQKKRRGGKRLRKMKERYGLTDVRKAANRMNFNQAEEEYLAGDEMVGLGVLGKEGSGRLRIVASQQKMKLTAKTAKKYSKANAGRGGMMSGLSSSLAFTPVQGFELSDPSKLAGNAATQLDSGRSGTESYFSTHTGFRSIGVKKM
eukprot:gene438-1836_t